MGMMGSMILRLVCFLLEFLGNSIMAFVTLQPYHHIGKSTKVVGLSLLLLLLEWLENLRCRLLRATQTVYRTKPSTSRLLLLPPEIRLQIWTILLEDTVDIEDIRYVEIRDAGLGLHTSYADKLRLYTGINPRYRTIWRLLASSFVCQSEWPPAFMQSCRQICHEAGYDLCSTKEFVFEDARPLLSWIKCITPAQKQAVGKVFLNLMDDLFSEIGIASAMEELSGLRKLHLWFSNEADDTFNTTELQAHHVYELVRSVQVSEVLMVTLGEETKCPDYDMVRVGSPADSQEEFACAVLARILNPLSPVQHRVRRRGRPSKFLLRVKRFYN